MAELVLAPKITAIANRNRITADDVLYLRGTVYKDGMSSRSEVENLFALDGAAHVKTDEWAVFLIEATCDYVVHQEKPEGYLSDENALWLKGLVARDGRVDGNTELELMIRVMESARSVPADYTDYLLAQLFLAVTEPANSLYAQDSVGHLRISAKATSAVRRVLYAMGGHGNVAVTRAEAELMFNLNDRATSQDNDPAWNDLFVKSIANFMMAASGFQTPSRERALMQDEFLNSAGGSGLGGFFSRMMESTFADPSTWLKTDSIEDRFAERNADMERNIAECEKVTGEEVQWLATRIGHDGRMGANERALIAFIKAESPSLHPEFQKLAAKVA